MANFSFNSDSWKIIPKFSGVWEKDPKKAKPVKEKEWTVEDYERWAKEQEIKEAGRRGLSPVTDFIRGMTSEGRNIYRNEDRTGSSERLTGFDIGGREYLYPSIFGGKDLFEQEPDTNAGRDAAMDKIISIFRKNRGYDPETNIFYGTGFSSREKANAFAKERYKGHRKYQLSDLLDVIRGRQ